MLNRIFLIASWLTLTAAFICENEGIFPDNSDKTCKIYVECKLNDGKFDSKSFICKEGFFHRELKICTDHYECEIGKDQNDENEKCMKACNLHRNKITVLLKNPKDGIIKCRCKGKGNFSTEMRKSTDVSQIYITNNVYYVNPIHFEQLPRDEQKTNANQSYRRFKRGLPFHAKFPDSDKKKCVITQDPFVCSSEGKFQDKSDPNCRRYFECFKNKQNKFIKMMFHCEYTFFDPSLQICTKEYKCPCQTKCLITDDKFICDSEGRFPDRSDTTCTQYYKCYMGRSDRIVSMLYKCPYKQKYDPAIGKCTNNYVCPCEQYS